MVLSPPFYELDGQPAVDLPGARAVFTTPAWGDVRESIGELAQRLQVWPVRPRQVHGNSVVQLDVKPLEYVLDIEADAVVTVVPGVAPLVMTADCLPIAISTPGAVAAVHAGWRGLDSGVIKSALSSLRALVPDATFTAAIGPGAGACCYEVGAELHERFPGFGSGNNLDLKAIARTQLEAAGVSVVHDCEVCTICGAAPEMFSFRRDGQAAGRQALVAWLS